MISVHFLSAYQKQESALRAPAVICHAGCLAEEYTILPIGTLFNGNRSPEWEIDDKVNRMIEQFDQAMKHTNNASGST